MELTINRWNFLADGSWQDIFKYQDIPVRSHFHIYTMSSARVRQLPDGYHLRY